MEELENMYEIIKKFEMDINDFIKQYEEYKKYKEEKREPNE